MQSSRIHRLAILIILLMLAMIVPTAGHSQSIWTNRPNPDTKVGAEVLIPDFHNINVEGAALALYLYSAVPVSNKIALKVDLPLSFFSSSSGKTKAGIGNPYVGVRFGRPQSAVTVDVGGRIPAASETSRALITGQLVENFRLSTFIPDVFAVSATAHYRYRNTNGLIVKLGGGPDIVSPDNGQGEAKLFVRYYGQLLYQIDALQFGGGVAGKLLATEQGLSFSDRTVNYVGLTGSYNFGGLTAGAYIRRPFDDDLNDFVRFVVGLNLTVLF